MSGPAVYQGPGSTNPTPEDIRKSKEARSHQDSRWWLIKEEDRASTVQALSERVFRQQIWRHNEYRRYMRMYNNMLGMLWSPLLTGGLDKSSGQQKLSLNVIKSTSDTFTSKMTLERPKCTFLTSGGDWTLQNKAKDLEKFLDGQFYEMKLYEDTPSVVLDSCVYGTAAYKTLVDGDLRDEEKAKNACVLGERTPIWQLGVDNRDAQYGKPRNLFQTRMADRLVVAETFPDKREEIMKADGPDLGENRNMPMWILSDDSVADTIQINEAWHLPSAKGANDGWHFVGTQDCTLVYEPWPHDYFPFAFYRRMPPLMGFYGIGLAEELRGIQQDINMMIQRAQAAIHLMAVPKWWAPPNSQISVGALNNQIDIVRSMQKPELMVPPGVLPPDFWQHLERQYQRSFELCGVNQMQAVSQKPAGLNSGKAQDTYIDIVSERFAVASRNYHDFVLEVGRQVIDRARDITKVYKKYAVISISKSTTQSVEFLKVDLTREQAVLQMYPTNKLSKDPAERMAQVEQLINGGMVDPNDAPRLLEFPDLQQEWNLKYASYELSMQMIDLILNEGTVLQPQPFMNLDETKKWATLKLLRATMAKAPEQNLQMLREWIEGIDTMQQEAAAKAAPPPTAPTQPGLPAGAPPAPGVPPQGGPPMPPPPGMNGAPPMAA